MAPLGLHQKFENCSATCKTDWFLGRATEVCDILQMERTRLVGTSNMAVTMAETGRDESKLVCLVELV